MTDDQKWEFSVAASLPVPDTGSATLGDFLFDRADDIENITHLNKISSGFDKLYEKALEGWEQEMSGKTAELDPVNERILADKIAPIVIRQKFFLAKSLYMEDLRLIIESLTRKIQRRERLLDELITEANMLNVFCSNARLAAVYHVLTVAELHEVAALSTQSQSAVPQFLETLIQRPEFRERYRDAVLIYTRETLLQQLHNMSSSTQPQKPLDRNVLSSRAERGELFRQHCLKQLKQMKETIEKRQADLRTELQQLNEQRAIRAQEFSMVQAADLIPPPVTHPS